MKTPRQYQLLQGVSMALLLTLLFTSCHSFEPLELRKISRFKMNRNENNEISFEVGISIFNPNPHPLTVSAYDLILTLDGITMGSSHSSEVQLLKGETEREFLFNIQSTPKKNLRKMITLLEDIRKKEALMLEITGTLTGRSRGRQKTLPVSFQQSTQLSKNLE